VPVGEELDHTAARVDPEDGGVAVLLGLEADLEDGLVRKLEDALVVLLGGGDELGRELEVRVLHGRPGVRVVVLRRGRGGGGNGGGEHRRGQDGGHGRGPRGSYGFTRNRSSAPASSLAGSAVLVDFF